LNITFDTDSSLAVPDNGPLGPGPYGPTNYDGGDGDIFPAPGPVPPFVNTVFGEAPNGDWKLWVLDDASADSGTIAGWCMNLSLYEPFLYACQGNVNTLMIPNGAPQTTFGPASPYQ